MKLVLTSALVGLVAGTCLGFTYEDGLPIPYPDYVEKDPVASALVAAITNKVATATTNYVFIPRASSTNYVVFQSNVNGTAYFDICVTNSGVATVVDKNSNTYFAAGYSTQLFTNNVSTKMLTTNYVDSGGNWDSTNREYRVPTNGVYSAWGYNQMILGNYNTPHFFYLVVGASGTTNTRARSGGISVTVAQDTPWNVAVTGIRLVAGDTISWYLFQQSGSTRTNSSSAFGAVRIGD